MSSEVHSSSLLGLCVVFVGLQEATVAAVREALAAEGVVVYSLASAREAAALLRHLIPHVLVTAVANLAAEPRLWTAVRGVAGVHGAGVLTLVGAQDDADWLPAAGFRRWISRPIEVTSLRATLEQMWAGRR